MILRSVSCMHIACQYAQCFKSFHISIIFGVILRLFLQKKFSNDLNTRSGDFISGSRKQVAFSTLQQRIMESFLVQFYNKFCRMLITSPGGLGLQMRRNYCSSRKTNLDLSKTAMLQLGMERFSLFCFLFICIKRIVSIVEINYSKLLPQLT